MPNILKGFLKPSVEAYTFLPTKDFNVNPEPLVDQQEKTVEEEASPHQDPKTPIDYARLQAEVILADANVHAAGILEAAREEVSECKEEARRQGRGEGYRDGYAEGMARAMDEARVTRENLAVRMEENISHFLDGVGRARDELMNETAEELRDLALVVAEKIVRISLKSSGDVVARMIQGGVEKLKRREWVHIYIAGCDAKSMAHIPPALTSALTAVSEHVKIVPMAEDESGTCIIEMPDEIIDASASTQLSNIHSLLSDMPYRD